MVRGPNGRRHRYVPRKRRRRRGLQRGARVTVVGNGSLAFGRSGKTPTNGRVRRYVDH